MGTFHAVAGLVREGHHSHRTFTLSIDGLATAPALPAFTFVLARPAWAFALPVFHNAAPRALLAGSVYQDGLGRALTVWRRSNHAAGAFRALLACLRASIPDLAIGTAAARRRADGAWRAGIVAGLVYEDFAWPAGPLAVRRRPDRPRSTRVRPASAFSEGSAVRAAVGRRTLWALGRAKSPCGLAASAVLVRLGERGFASVALRLRAIEWFGRVIVALASAAALVSAATTALIAAAAAAALIAAAAALICAAAAVVFSGITAIVVLFGFAIVEANALLADGDAFPGGACVEGKTNHKDGSRKHQTRQFEEMRFMHSMLETAFDAALECGSFLGAESGVSLAGCSRRSGFDRDVCNSQEGKAEAF